MSCSHQSDGCCPAGVDILLHLRSWNALPSGCQLTSPEGVRCVSYSVLFRPALRQSEERQSSCLLILAAQNPVAIKPQKIRKLPARNASKTGGDSELINQE